jgi:hypothetical protein
MRRVEHLIKQIRRYTENVKVGSSDGILDIEFVQYLNDAQESMLSGIYSLTNNDLFVKEYLVSAIYGQEEYDLPFDIYTDSHVISVKWSRTGQARDLVPLEKRRLRDRFQETGDPGWYMLRNGKILFNKIPQSANQYGSIQYNPRLPKLDIRSGKVDAVTLDGGTNTITSLTLASAFDVTLTNALFNEADYLTVVDRDGVIQMKAIPIDDVNTSTGVVTIGNGFVYEAGETITTDHYVCLGSYTSTHSSLPENCERFLLEWGYKKIFTRDSSEDWQIAKADLMEARGDILTAISVEHSDIDWIPETNEDY